MPLTEKGECDREVIARKVRVRVRVRVG